MADITTTRIRVVLGATITIGNGHPAHLHTNGVCPYAADFQTDNTSAGGNDTTAAETPSITYDLMDSYSRVFDPDYYYNTYPDLQTAIGTDQLALFTHFYNSAWQREEKVVQDLM